MDNMWTTSSTGSVDIYWEMDIVFDDDIFNSNDWEFSITSDYVEFNYFLT